MFQNFAPVQVEVDVGVVTRVAVSDEALVCNPAVVDGDESDLPYAVAAANDAQAWPSWQFGFRRSLPSLNLRPGLAPGLFASGA